MCKKRVKIRTNTNAVNLGRIKGLQKGSCYSSTKLFDNETLFVSNKRNIIVVSFYMSRPA